ncbi:MAG TPA: hypothetical protein VG253_05810, partial [Streptosporangiaceae bacterium]|nr:hypothetical protein [Streptosporangiaceae bacterium]
MPVPVAQHPQLGTVMDLFVKLVEGISHAASLSTRCVIGVRGRGGGEDADHWRAEGEGLGAHLREAGAPQQVPDLIGGAAGRARRGAVA